MTAAPVLVIGGGLAGAACACVLARAGRSVTVYERDAGPRDKICGEFLSYEAQHYLRDLGLDLPGLGAEPIGRVRLIRRAASITRALPFRGLSLSRRTLDAALLQRADTFGATIRRGAPLRGLSVRDGVARVEADHSPGGPIVLATGKHDLRGATRRYAAPELLGFKMYFQLAAPQRQALAGCAELFLFADGYAGLEPVENGRANLCLLTTPRRWQNAGSQWSGLLASLTRDNPILAERLRHAAAMLDKPLTIARVPYGFVHRDGPADPRNLFRVGDQMAVIPSFSGDGMSIALHTGIQAGTAILAGDAAGRYHHRMGAEVGRQMAAAQLCYRVGRHRVGQAVLFRAAGLLPGLLARLASATRLPTEALGFLNVASTVDCHSPACSPGMIHGARADTEPSLDTRPV